MILSKKQYSPTMNLPSEILVDIFSRVSTKSLHRFRCVSSYFGSLIYEHYFQKKHLGHAVRYSNLESKKLLLGKSYFFPHHYHVFRCEVLSFLLSNNVHTIIRERDYESKNVSLQIVNFLCSSFKGLFCVECDYVNRNDDGLFLWNPTIDEFKRLPLVHEFWWVEECCYGLGYDSGNDDYVVVRLTMYRHDFVMYGSNETHDFDDEVYGSNKVNLYSLRTDSWRLLKPFPYDIGAMLDCQFVKDRFHWMVRPFPHVIVSLSLSNYEYKDIPQPNYRKVPNFEGKDNIEIFVLDGMLCVYCNYFQDSFDLWVMKDYEIQESWMMILSISHDDVLVYDGHTSLNKPSKYLKFYPLYLFDNGDVLLQCREGLRHYIVIYKKNEKILTTLVDGPSYSVIAGGGYFSLFPRAEIYTETLMSPNCF